MAVSHGTLAIITDAVPSYMIRRWRLNTGVFVDDLILIVKMILHRLCNGLLGGCPICIAALPAALKLQDALGSLHLDQLDKSFIMAQQELYLDVNVNSNRGLYTPLEHLETVAKLVHDLDEVCEVVVFTSPRKCSKVRVRLSNYSFCLQRIRPFIAPFNSFIGSHRNTGDRDWDLEKAITDEMLDA